MPILPLGIEQEVELLVYAVCAGTLVNNSVSQSSRREAPSDLWQDRKPLVTGAASGATAKQQAHLVEVGEAVGHHAVAQVTRGLVPGHVCDCAGLRHFSPGCPFQPCSPL